VLDGDVEVGAVGAAPFEADLGALWEAELALQVALICPS
jgi:hypothetical protein